MMTVSETSIQARPDPRIFRSETAIRQALLELMASGREFGSVTVSEIAVKAGVTRKTFYARFGSPEQVVGRVVMDLFSEVSQHIDDELLRLPLQDNSLAMTVFKAYEQHQAVLAPLVQHCPASLFIEPVSAVTESLLDRVIEVNQLSPLDDVEKAYLIATVASMVHGILSVWVRRGFSESPEQVAGFIDRLLADGLQKVVLSPRD